MIHLPGLTRLAMQPPLLLRSEGQAFSCPSGLSAQGNLLSCLCPCNSAAQRLAARHCTDTADVRATAQVVAGA